MFFRVWEKWYVQSEATEVCEFRAEIPAFHCSLWHRFAHIQREKFYSKSFCCAFCRSYLAFHLSWSLYWPAILLKFTHFRLCIENKQLRLLRVLGLPHILTVIYVFINVFTKKLIQYMWSLVRASPRCTWSATFPKMIKYFVEKKNTLNNERYRDLLISILSYDEVSAFLLWVKTRN